MHWMGQNQQTMLQSKNVQAHQKPPRKVRIGRQIWAHTYTDIVGEKKRPSIDQPKLASNLKESKPVTKQIQATEEQSNYYMLFSLVL